ncbi:MAG: ankyrin repeat domain-containing protein [Alphaproteobacteria bacterium]
MSRTLTPDSNLETLRREAKRWLKALRAGDPEARRRLVAAVPASPAEPGLRDVQLALAREHGLAGWAALRQALEDKALAARPQPERVEVVLRSAWDGDRVAARRLLALQPEIGRADIFTAVATGDLAEVRRRLAADPEAARRKGGPLDWEPLLYLAYARLPGRDGNGVAIATLLLDGGADPNARFSDNWENPFTVLTGVVGQGEGDRPPHPEAEALAALLVDRGADPFDTQALYNTSVARDETVWLDFLWQRAVEQGVTVRWTERLEKPRIGGRIPLPVIDYLLGNAVAYDHLARAEWLLRHDADAGGPHAYSGRPQREEALTNGFAAMADLLVRYGAPTPPLEGAPAFQAACMAGDRAAAAAIAGSHPDVLADAEPMLRAARMGRIDVVELLLDLGMDVDVADHTGLRALQVAASRGHLDIARLLLANGAVVDRPTIHYGGAMGFAQHFGQRAMAELLAPFSRDTPDMVSLGLTDRLAELFAEDPGLVNAVYQDYGMRPIFCLPDDEAEAARVATFLMAHGADPTVTDRNGLTPAEVVRRRGLLDAADVLDGEG